MASTYLKRTPAGAGDSNRIFTLSLWFKRANLTGAEQYLFECNEAADNNDNFRLIIGSGENLIIQDTEANVSNLDLRTNRLFRDTSAWYHLVLEVDTTQATSSDRAKLYINGIQETSFSTSTYPSQNYDTNVSQSGEPFIIGRRESTASPGSYFDGSMTHYHFTDGTAYDASYFGQTETSSGIWKPKTSPSVTYGTNGFFLKFGNAGSLGTDSSGNGNNFTVNGTGTQTLDTPSNVFSTINNLDGASAGTFTNGNLTLTSSTNPKSTLGFTQGKWYFECKLTTQSGSQIIGVASESMTSATTLGSDANGWGYVIEDNALFGANGKSYHNNSLSSVLQTFANNDILGVAVDMDNQALYFSVNGTFVNSGDPTSGASKTGAVFTNLPTSGFVFPCFRSTSSGVVNANFGNGYFGTTAVSTSESDSAGLGKFEYAVPSGYYALCTKNIAEYG